MAHLGIPTIEYLDLIGYPEYDNKESLRDDKNIPVFLYRYQKIVHGVSSLSELEDTVNFLMKKQAKS